MIDTYYIYIGVNATVLLSGPRSLAVYDTWYVQLDKIKRLASHLKLAYKIYEACIYLPPFNTSGLRACTLIHVSTHSVDSLRVLFHAMFKDLVMFYIVTTYDFSG